MTYATITHDHYKELRSITDSLANKYASDHPGNYQNELSRLTTLIVELGPLFDQEEPAPFHQRQ
jgi:hypothetical protein